MNEKTTIFDYVRLCEKMETCSKCALDTKNNGQNVRCEDLIKFYPDDANKIILDWCKAHPVKTRQREFLKLFPNASMTDGVIDICPQSIDNTFTCINGAKCKDCFKEYWSEEVEEK